jgi:predicted ATPase
MFGEGKFHLIPSFFRTLVYNKKQKREFSVIFRSMGDEVEKVIWEFNQFCIGQHPCFSGRNGTPLVKFDGSKGTKDLRIKGQWQ